MFQRLRSLFRAIGSRQNFEAGMTEEMRFHIEEYAADLFRSGVSTAEALRRARIEFGGLNSVEGDCREARGLLLFDELRRELSHALRLLRRAPAFAATALLTLALCLGANLTIFAVIDSVLLRSLPFPEANRLVTVFNTYLKAGVDRDGSSITNYYERRGHIPALASISIYRFGTAVVGEAGSTERQEITQVSAEFFATLGRGPRLGRAFTDQETTYATDRTVILTDGYWREHYNADPHVLGRSVRIDGVAKTVVGVLPPDFSFLSSQARLYVPLASSLENRLPRQRHSGGNVTQMIARLRPGVALSQAQSQIDSQNAALEIDDPQAKMMADAGFRSLVVPLHADHVAAIRPTLLLLQAGVLSLLLIGVVNLVNLLLVRASGRLKEVAVRQALGANGRHVVTEVIVETTVLAVLGGLLGLAVAAGGIRLLATLGTDRLPLGAHIALDMRVACVGLAAAIVASILLAAPIAWFNLSGGQMGNALRSEPRGGTAGRAAQRLRHGFIVAQIALAFVLLSGAGLLGLSLQRAMAVSPGFRKDNIITGQISLPSSSYPDARSRVAFTESLMAKLSRQPGVLSSGVVSNLPLSGRNGKAAATAKGHVRRPGESPRGNYSYGVAGDYFDALGFTLKEGRFLSAADSRRAQRMCVVDDEFAQYYWPHTSALGRLLFQGSEEEKDAVAFTVVGVVGHAKQAALTDEEAQGAVYYPAVFYNGDVGHLSIAMRTSRAPESLGPALQTLVRQIDAGLPVSDVRAMESRVADSLLTRRSPVVLAALFSGVALLLTAVGTFGVLSYAVTQSRREIGVRMALGARPAQIRMQFLGQALRLMAAGAAFGLFGAWLAGRAMQAVLFHVPAFHLATLAGVATIIGAVSLAACLLPSERAARISPVEALSE